MSTLNKISDTPSKSPPEVVARLKRAGFSRSILVLLDEASSSEACLHVSLDVESPAWFDLPAEIIEGVDVVGARNCGRVYPEVLVTLKEAVAILLPLIESSQRKPDRRSRSIFALQVTGRQDAGKVPITSWAWPYMGRNTDDGDFGPGSAWVNSEGHWGLACHISNHSIWQHSYRVTFDFGTANGDGSGFVAYYRGSSNTIQLSGHHDEGDVSGGSGDSVVDVLHDNFSKITHGTLKMYEDC